LRCTGAAFAITTTCVPAAAKRGPCAVSPQHSHIPPTALPQLHLGGQRVSALAPLRKPLRRKSDVWVCVVESVPYCGNAEITSTMLHRDQTRSIICRCSLFSQGRCAAQVRYIKGPNNHSMSIMSTHPVNSGSSGRDDFYTDERRKVSTSVPFPRLGHLPPVAQSTTCSTSPMILPTNAFRNENRDCSSSCRIRSSSRVVSAVVAARDAASVAACSSFTLRLCVRSS